MRYLRGTSNLSLNLGDGELLLIGYTDSDMAGHMDTRKSISVYLITFTGDAISWQSKFKKCIALFTTEAEFIVATEACKELLWMKKFLRELGFNQHRYFMKMPEIQYGGHTVKSHGRKLARTHLHDWLILILLAAIDGGLNAIKPFHRYIGKEMMTDLKYPFKVQDTIPMWAVPIYAVILPFIIFLIYYLRKRDVYDLHHATLGILYSVLVTGVITDSIKDAVGRPRPNFFFRCFPDGEAVFSPQNGDVLCSGDKRIIKEGYKSFPSGHTSWSFAGLGFLSWYLCGKVKAFDQRGHIAKILIILLPYLFAALIGISRVDDYWHHWTDVFVGALIGSVVSSMCYLQFFPFPNSINCWATHTFLRMLEETGAQSSSTEMDTAYVQFNRENSESNDQETTQDLEAMVSGKRY